jgi:hypothetical protein
VRFAIDSPAGQITHFPFSTDPNSAAKQAPEEKSGKQSQSIDPSNPTNAAVRQFPIIAYDSIFALTAKAYPLFYSKLIDPLYERIPQKAVIKRAIGFPRFSV